MSRSWKTRKHWGTTIGQREQNINNVRPWLGSWNRKKKSRGGEGEFLSLVKSVVLMLISDFDHCKLISVSCQCKKKLDTEGILSSVWFLQPFVSLKLFQRRKKDIYIASKYLPMRYLTTKGKNSIFNKTGKYHLRQVTKVNNNFQPLNRNGNQMPSNIMHWEGLIITPVILLSLKCIPWI